MDFDLTPEQREVQATVRRFVDEQILPNAVENDIKHRLDMEAIEGMAELGLLGIVIPEEYGGAGMDYVCEAVGPGSATFPPFTPGIAGDYEASTTANVISSAGDAALSVADPSAQNTGHLVNGSFFLPSKVQARARNAANQTGNYADVGSIRRADATPHVLRSDRQRRRYPRVPSGDRCQRCVADRPVQ